MSVCARTIDAVASLGEPRSLLGSPAARRVASVGWAALLAAPLGCTEAPGASCSGAPPVANDTRERATSIGASGNISGRLCLAEARFFRFAAPVPGGGIFTVTIDSAPRELGVVVTSSASGEEFWSHAPFVGGQQRVGVVSDGGDYTVRVTAPTAPSDVAEQPFTLHVHALPAASNDCCTAAPGPGCADPGLLACLCERDTECCGTRYDELCVTQAMADCGLRCADASPQSDGCSASLAPGCTSPSVEACVCDIDPYCCVGGFDQNCVHLAQNRCAAPCAAGAPGEP